MDKAVLYRSIFSRNIGLLSPKEQMKLARSSVAIAGVGGIGGLLAERLARMGLGTFHLSDPDAFEISNVNRQFASGMRTLKVKKATAVKRELMNINPAMTVTIDHKGIVDQTSADLFVKSASIVVDEMNFGLLKEAVYLQRAARRQKKYYLFSSAIGFGCRVAIFDPRGMTLEAFNGISPEQIDSADGQPVLPLKKISPHLPRYIQKKLKTLPLSAILSGQKPVPVCSIGAGIAAIVTAQEVVNLILGLRKIPTAPDVIDVDLLEGTYRISRVK